MKKNGTMTLNTDGGSRKMHYCIVDSKIVTTTAPDARKLEQIKKNPKVTIDLTDFEYNATILEGEENKKMVETYRASMPKFQRIINKLIGSKEPIAIVLEKNN